MQSEKLSRKPYLLLFEMQIIQSNLFKNFPELIFGFSTKVGLNRAEPFYFNLSYNVGDDKEIVRKNREAFLSELGLTSHQIAYQNQIHSDIVTIIDKGGMIGESDAMITSQTNIGLAITSADCAPIFIYDHHKKIIAAVHSGWRGTQKRIIEKVFLKLIEEFSVNISDLFIYIGPSISVNNYEVGKEVAEQFDSTFIKRVNGKYYLDVVGAIVSVLKEFKIEKKRLEVSPLCSFDQKELLHSYRRDGKFSGRSLGIISMKGNE